MCDLKYTYRFAIDANDLGDLPMGRLAEYMADLARLFSNADQAQGYQMQYGGASCWCMCRE